MRHELSEAGYHICATGAFPGQGASTLASRSTGVSVTGSEFSAKSRVHIAAAWTLVLDKHIFLSQAEALCESESQITGLACQDTRYKGPVYQTARLNKNNNQLTHNFHPIERSPSRATISPI